MAAPARDPITCHVLDTTTGRPAANISVKLIPNGGWAANVAHMSSQTNTDGRIMVWHNVHHLDGSSTPVNDCHATITALIEEMAQPTATAACPAGSSIWKLEFDTGSYYGAANTFFPKVELTFLVKEEEHFHVPLLLGPYSFTTYRGS